MRLGGAWSCTVRAEARLGGSVGTATPIENRRCRASRRPGCLWARRSWCEMEVCRRGSRSHPRHGPWPWGLAPELRSSHTILHGRAAIDDVGGIRGVRAQEECLFVRDVLPEVCLCLPFGAALVLAQGLVLELVFEGEFGCAWRRTPTPPVSFPETEAPK